MKHKKLLLILIIASITIISLLVIFLNTNQNKKNGTESEKVVSTTKLESIKFDSDKISLTEGESKTLSITFLPESSPDTSIYWASNNDAIATVSQDGTINAISEGSCIIQANSINNKDIKASIEILVQKKPTNTYTNPNSEKNISKETDNKSSSAENDTSKKSEKISSKTKNVDESVQSSSSNSNSNGITYIQGILIVNKTYSIPSTYNPGENPEARNAFNKMKDAAKICGLNLYISSGFRSYSKQEQIYNRYVSKSSKNIVDTYSARPGHSEHQTGLAFDLNGLEGFDKTQEYIWLKDNAHLYGFIIRYPDGKQSITGFKFEPWHIRYVGVDLATKLYNSKLCIEEYFNIDSKYK